MSVRKKAPLLSAISNQTAYNGAALAIGFTAADPNGSGNVTYSLSGAQAGMTINSAMPEIDWTPHAILPGTQYTVTLTAIDAGTLPLFDSKTFVVTVGNTAPTLAAVADKTAYNGQQLSVQLSATIPTPHRRR